MLECSCFAIPKAEVYVWYFSQGGNISVPNAYTNEEKANVLEIQFSKVFTKGDKSECDHVSVEPSCQLNKESILAKLAALNTSKSPSPDGFHPRILYQIRQELVEPLEILFATSLKSSTLPMDWRSANITAIYKKGV